MQQIKRRHGSATKEAGFPNTSKGDQRTFLYRSSIYERGGGNQTCQTKASSNTRGNEQRKAVSKYSMRRSTTIASSTKIFPNQHSRILQSQQVRRQQGKPLTATTTTTTLLPATTEPTKLSHDDVVQTTKPSNRAPTTSPREIATNHYHTNPKDDSLQTIANTTIATKHEDTMVNR